MTIFLLTVAVLGGMLFQGATPSAGPPAKYVAGTIASRVIDLPDSGILDFDDEPSDTSSEGNSGESPQTEDMG